METPPPSHTLPLDAAHLVAQLQAWGFALGFSQIGVAGVDLQHAEAGLLAWLAQGYHGQMDYMAVHGLKRARPAELLPGTLSVITARMDYLPTSPGGVQAHLQAERLRLEHADQAVVSLYARGRDYHKVLRQRLSQLQAQLEHHLTPYGHRVTARPYTDSAPVLEAELATQSGLGWRGKHSLALHREAGSFFFLGELFVDLALPPTAPTSAHCGQCQACMEVCPTQAIVAPYRVDARRCISYLTIEHRGPIPLELRPLMGNRIYGCDDCQLHCPWNKYAQASLLADFAERPHWPHARIHDLLTWNEVEFLQHTEGSPIRRIGHERWLRNLAIAAGNALASGQIPAPEHARLRTALAHWQTHASEVVREAVGWALRPGSGNLNQP